MELFMIYAWIVLISTINFSFSFIYSGVTKVFNGVYKGAIESTVINYDNQGNKTTPYFYVSKCRLNIVSYFQNNIEKYAKQYYLKVDFYIYKTDIINEQNPTEVNVILQTNIPYIGTTTLSASYAIVEGEK